LYNEEQNGEAMNNKLRLITLSEASKIYGFEQTYLSKLAQRGRLQAQKFGRMWLTTPASVEQYIESRQQRGVYRHDIVL
jgi:hypothetical protein